MKKFILLSFSLCLFSLGFSQSIASIAGMKITKFGITASYDQDMIKNIGADYFFSTSRDGINADIENFEFNKQDIYSMICENPAIRAELTLQPFRALRNIQLNAGASVMFNRRDGASYYSRPNNNNSYNDIRFSSYSNEAAIDLTMLYHQKLLFLHLYGGVGTNLGMTFAGEMNVSGSYYKEATITGEGTDGGEIVDRELVRFNERHDMKNLIHQRVFFQGAATFIFLKRLELGLEGRAGVGYRYGGGHFAPTELSSIGLIAKWNLR